MSRTTIATRSTATRTILGTDWPVTDRVEREQLRGGRPTWILTLGLCNGVPDSATEYRTRREALEAFGS